MSLTQSDDAPARDGAVFCSEGCGRKAKVLAYHNLKMNVYLENVCHTCIARVTHEMVTANKPDGRPWIDAL